jgi:hypothetical protein
MAALKTLTRLSLASVAVAPQTLTLMVMEQLIAKMTALLT